jgi:hypothetical protein
MTPTQFIAAIHRLGFPSPYAAAGAIGVSISQAHRYANGSTPIPETVRLLLEMYLRHGLAPVNS